MNESVLNRTQCGGHPCVLYDWPCLDYEIAWDAQRRFVEERKRGEHPDALIIVEHHPVFTSGRTTQPAHFRDNPSILEAKGFRVHVVERGGSVTYHGPGQLVGYPILELRNYCAGPKGYVRKLEEVLIQVLAQWGIAGTRVDRYPGVWVRTGPETTQKIAAVGVRISQGVTMHGFSLNVTVALEPFTFIHPCGIEHCQVTSMAQVLGYKPSLAIVREQIAEHFAKLFDLTWTNRATDAESFQTV